MILYGWREIKEKTAELEWRQTPNIVFMDVGSPHIVMPWIQNHIALLG